ncbi:MULTISPECIES: hypothetical protein [unclassified Microcoleus]
MFNQVQESLLLSELARLEKEVKTAQPANLSCLDERLAHLQI